MTGRDQRRSIAVLISGRGGNMRALIERSRDPDLGYEVVAVFADQPDAAGLSVARELGIPAALVASKALPRAQYDSALAAAIDACAPDLIVLAGFMRILSAGFVSRYAGRMLNIHPSLLPRYSGLHTHQRVLDAHESEHGATVHFVTEELDAGPRIIQGRVRVAPDDDAASLAARVQVLEHRIYPLAVSWYCTGRLRCDTDGAMLDGRRLLEPVHYCAEDR